MSQAPPPAEPSSQPVETDTEFQDLAGQPPKRWDEARRYPRFSFRARVEATVHPLAENTTQTAFHCAMMTRDLSRGGINLLHCDQLFPGQKIEITLNESRRCVEVVWCRRLANRCYSAGCRFITADGLPSESAAPRPPTPDS